MHDSRCTKWANKPLHERKVQDDAKLQQGGGNGGKLHEFQFIVYRTHFLGL